VHRYSLPETETPKDVAYQIISDELMLDGNPRLNLASFVTTWMEPECDKLILSALNKNYIDMDEYPITTEFQVLSSGSLNPTITENMGNQ
jgi:glutamate decarboxylase